MIVFDDGKPIDPSGAWRIEIRKKIRYVLGMNHMIVVDTHEEGIEEIRKLDPEANIVKRYDIAEAKRRAEFFYRGRKYKMVRAGGSIRGYMPRGTIWSCTLEVGDIVTYEGFTCREIKTGIYCRSFPEKSFEFMASFGQTAGEWWTNLFWRYGKNRGPVHRRCTECLLIMFRFIRHINLNWVIQ